MRVEMVSLRKDRMKEFGVYSLKFEVLDCSNYKLQTPNLLAINDDSIE
jgi:hypothetical protein